MEHQNVSNDGILSHNYRPATAIPDEEGYGFLHHYIEMCDLIGKNIDNQVVYISDHHKEGFVYVSAMPSLLFSLTPEAILKRGFSLFTDYLPSSDVKYIRRLKQAWFDFLAERPALHASNYVLSYNLRLHPKNYGDLVITNRLSVLRLDEQHKPWLLLGMLSAANDHRIHMGRIGLMGQASYWEFDEQTDTFNFIDIEPLSEVEKKLIYFSKQNLSISEISALLERSESTVKGYRNVLKKRFRVDKFGQVIAEAVAMKLLWI